MDEIGIPMSGTKNVNINQTQADSSDNVQRPTSKKRTFKLEPSHIIAGILAAFGYITIWFLSLNVANFYCWTKDDYYCQSSDIIHIVFILGIIAALVIPTVGGLIYAIQSAKNAEYIELARGISLSRGTLDRYAPELIDVMRISAQSEATTGINTYSPSYTGIKPDKPIITVPDAEIGIMTNVSGEDTATGALLDEEI